MLLRPFITATTATAATTALATLTAGQRRDPARSIPLKFACKALGIACLAACVLAAPTSVDAAETYYRWKDARGNLVVSDRPPASEDIEYEVVSQRSSLTRRVQPGEGAVPAEVVPRPGNRFDQVDATDITQEVKKNPEACSRARINLETLNSSARIRIRDENTGELRYLDEEEQLSQRQKAEDIIRVHCN